MVVTRLRCAVLGIALAAAVGYGAVPQNAASGATPGMTLGGVPMAPAPMSATVVIGRGAATKGYTTKVVTISQGGSLSAVNLDSIDHTVTAVAHNAKGVPLFDVDVSPGSTASIPGASKLAAGTYDFYCEFHPTMRGKLVVEGTGGGGVHPVAQRFEQPLVTPKVLTGSHITLRTRRSMVRVLPHGPKTAMWTYGGSYPGPTLDRPAGKDTKVTFINDLPTSAGAITVHFHGDHHSSANDGQPDSHLIGHDRRRTYNYPLTDAGAPERAAFDFYHDHRMGETARNNWMGLQGMFIVHDNRTPKLRLPTGKFDVPLMVADRSFTADNQLTDPFPAAPMSMTMGMTGPHAPPNDAAVGNQILVDGRYAPYLRVATHRYRLRLLNASDYTSYDFALSDGRPFVQIGTGSGLLPKPVVRQDILLGPAQRADVIVDFHGELSNNVVLESIPSTDPSLSGVGTPSASIMQFRVRHQAKRDRTRIPSKLEPPPPLKAPKKISAIWTFGLGGNQLTGTYWTVNGKPYDPHRVDLKVPLGSTETWLLRNVSPITHYIHIHEEQWHTIAYDGKKPPPWQRGLEDTWRIDPGESVKVAAKFTDYTGVFMIHCHMLNHEDDGMMAQFAVVKPHSKALPAGFYDDHSATPRIAHADRTTTMAMAAPMTMPMQRATGMTPAPTWSRVLGRIAKALAVQAALIALLIGASRLIRPYRTARQQVRARSVRRFAARSSANI
jgi:spore coat protein A, manganese oxidase